MKVKPVQGIVSGSQSTHLNIYTGWTFSRKKTIIRTSIQTRHSPGVPLVLYSLFTAGPYSKYHYSHSTEEKTKMTQLAATELGAQEKPLLYVHTTSGKPKM